jgi:hypothetical protein
MDAPNVDEPLDDPAAMDDSSELTGSMVESQLAKMCSKMFAGHRDDCLASELLDSLCKQAGAVYILDELRPILLEIEARGDVLLRDP